MRAFHLASLLLGSYGVSASMTKVTVSLPKGCIYDCKDKDVTTLEALTACLESVQQPAGVDCEIAKMKVDYDLPEAAQCPESKVHLLSAGPTPANEKPAIEVPLLGVKKEFSDALKPAGDITKVDLTSVSLAFKLDKESDCQSLAAYSVNGDDLCTGEQTAIKVSQKAGDTGIVLSFDEGTEVTDGLVVQWDSVSKKQCKVEPVGKSKSTVNMEMVAKIKPYTMQSTGTMAFEGCTVAVDDCPEEITTALGAQHCINAAAKDTKCESATYVRTFTGMGAAACDVAEKASRISMSLKKIAHAESVITAEGVTMISDVYFPKAAGTDCNEAKLYLVDRCADKLSNPLALTQNGEIMEFTGSQPVGPQDEKKTLLLAFKDDKCTLTRDSAGDWIKMQSTYSIDHTSPSAATGLIGVPAILVGMLLSLASW